MLKNPKDKYLVLVLLIQLGTLCAPFFVELHLWGLVLNLVINVFLIGTNYQCVAHNFIHLPFFKNKNLNSMFSVMNSIGLGLPQSAYRLHHLHHHRHNNRPEEDESSTRRFGKDGKDENIFTYSILGIFRTDILALIQNAAKGSVLVYVEVISIAAFLGILSLINWKLTLGLVLPTYFLGQVFALWENYCEHHHADPYDRKRDSVSCYNRLYNLVWFNNGYHQEHHFSPQVHWTQIDQVRTLLPEDRVIVKGCHLTNSF